MLTDYRHGTRADAESPDQLRGRHPTVALSERPDPPGRRRRRAVAAAGFAFDACEGPGLVVGISAPKHILARAHLTSWKLSLRGRHVASGDLRHGRLVPCRHGNSAQRPATGREARVVGTCISKLGGCRDHPVGTVVRSWRNFCQCMSSGVRGEGPWTQTNASSVGRSPALLPEQAGTLLRRR